MKNEALYNKTVNILVQAYFNDTLQRMSCYACAIGNIVAGNNGYKIIASTEPDDHRLTWDVCNGKYSGTEYGRFFSVVKGINYSDETTYKLISSTGYTVAELSKIERSFMTASRTLENDPMFNGLMAVIDVLDEIHENTDTVITKSSKQLFVRA